MASTAVNDFPPKFRSTENVFAALREVRDGLEPLRPLVELAEYIHANIRYIDKRIVWYSGPHRTNIGVLRGNAADVVIRSSADASVHSWASPCRGATNLATLFIGPR